MEGNDLIIFVLDLNGRLLQKKAVGKEWDQRYPGTRGTINVNEGKLYLTNSLGVIFCLDEDSLNEIWRKNVISEFGGRNLMWGMTESPLIVDDKIIITPGGNRHNIVALNKHTGTLIWSSSGEGGTSTYCSPLYITGYAVPMIVTNTSEHIIALNANTGAKIWSHRQLTQSPASRNIHPNTPLYHNGHIFSTTGYRGGSMLLRLSANGQSVRQVWTNDVDNQMGGAVRIGNYVYTSGHQNRGFACIDWNTGNIKYRTTDIGNGTTVAADGKIYHYSDRGEIALIAPNPDRFELISKFNVTLGTNEHWAHLVIHRGVMYVRHGDTLMAYKIH
jgi:outer membrane protein assembly factor BamB